MTALDDLGRSGADVEETLIAFIGISPLHSEGHHGMEKTVAGVSVIEARLNSGVVIRTEKEDPGESAGP